MQFIFWICMGFIFYSVVLYYFILKLVKQNQYQQDEHFKPLITMIICAYNEEKNIAEKLLNIQSLSYPMDKLQVILADDNSSDNTVEIASKFDFVEILELPRCGKTKAQNEAVKIARNEILVFSDANNIYAQDALDKLARNFVDERVGVVCGELHYKDKQSLESTYWKYEIAIKKEESKSGRLIGANGSISVSYTHLTLPTNREV